MAAREKKLDQGYQGYQKWGGVFEKEYIWWNIQADKRLWGLRVSSRQQRSLHQRQGYARLQDCIGFSESSSSDRLTDEQENEIAENIYDWWTSGLGYRQWYAQKFLQLKLDFDAQQS